MEEPSRQNIWEMFNDISPTYDRINQILSFGLDRRCRKKLLQHLPSSPNLSLLDIATGTGDQIFTLMEGSTSIKKAVGIDPAEKMLAIAEKKRRQKPYHPKVSFVTGSSDLLPFEDNSFDVVSISFGIRNVQDIEKTIHEVKRVLRPGGKLLILEFSLPKKPVRTAYLWYLRYVLPKIGGALSNNLPAYRYLNQTIETFPSGTAFLQILQTYGLSKVKARPLLFGSLHIYEAWI